MASSSSKGFRVTGLWPLNKNIFSEIDYLAAQQDAVKDGCTINATPTKSSSQSKESSTNDARPPDNSLILIETSFTPRQGTEFDPEPSISRLARSTLNLVSPYDISPVPVKKRKISNRGRKATNAEIITSSPYKNQLIDSNEKKKEKENKLSKQKNKKQKEKKTKDKQQKKKIKSQNSPIDSDDEEEIRFDTDSEPDAVIGLEVPDSEDAECMFCNSLFSQDTQGEAWIKCLMCRLWAHGDCAGAEFDT